MTLLEQQVEALTQQFQDFLSNQNQQNHKPYDSGDDYTRSDNFWEVPRQRCKVPIRFEDDRRQVDKEFEEEENNYFESKLFFDTSDIEQEITILSQNYSLTQVTQRKIMIGWILAHNLT